MMRRRRRVRFTKCLCHGRFTGCAHLPGRCAGTLPGAWTASHCAECDPRRAAHVARAQRAMAVRRPQDDLEGWR